MAITARILIIFLLRTHTQEVRLLPAHLELARQCILDTTLIIPQLLALQVVLRLQQQLGPLARFRTAHLLECRLSLAMCKRRAQS